MRHFLLIDACTSFAAQCAVQFGVEMDRVYLTPKKRNPQLFGANQTYIGLQRNFNSQRRKCLINWKLFSNPIKHDIKYCRNSLFFGCFLFFAPPPFYITKPMRVKYQVIRVWRLFMNNFNANYFYAYAFYAYIMKAIMIPNTRKIQYYFNFKQHT